MKPLGSAVPIPEYFLSADSSDEEDRIVASVTGLDREHMHEPRHLRTATTEHLRSSQVDLGDEFVLARTTATDILAKSASASITEPYRYRATPAGGATYQPVVSATVSTVVPTLPMGLPPATATATSQPILSGLDRPLSHDPLAAVTLSSIYDTAISTSATQPSGPPIGILGGVARDVTSVISSQQYFGQQSRATIVGAVMPSDSYHTYPDMQQQLQQQLHHYAIDSPSTQVRGTFCNQRTEINSQIPTSVLKAQQKLQQQQQQAPVPVTCALQWSPTDITPKVSYSPQVFQCASSLLTYFFVLNDLFKALR